MSLFDAKMPSLLDKIQEEEARKLQELQEKFEREVEKEEKKVVKIKRAKGK